MSRSRNLLVPALALALLVVVGALGVFVLSDDGPTDPPPADPDAVVVKPTQEPTGTSKKPPRIAALRPSDIPRPAPIRDTAQDHGDADAPVDVDAAPTFPIEVIVRAAGGAPAADASVAVVAAFGGLDIDNVLGQQTDEQGLARFALTQAAFVRVFAHRGDQVALSERFSADTEAGVRKELTLEPGIVATGRVTHDGGLPLPGSAVKLAFVTKDEFGLELSLRADESGTFRAPPAPRSMLGNPHRITARAPGYVERSVQVRTDQLERGDFEIDLDPAVLVRGRCVSTRGEPIGNVFVRTVAPGANTRTAIDGTFELDGVQPDGRPLIFVPDQHAARIYRGVPAQPGTAEIGDVVLEDGHTLPGIVVDAQGQPLVGAQVEASSEAIGLVVRTAVTGEDGRFELPHLDSVPHTLRVKEGGEAVAWSVRRTATVEHQEPDGNEVRVVLSGGLSVHLTFQAEADRSPVVVPSVRLEARPTGTAEGGYAWAWSGANISDVRFQVERGGTFDVTVEIPGYEPAEARGLLVTPEVETRISVLFRKRPE